MASVQVSKHPDAGIPHFYVTRKGSDTNDGRSWGSAKATIEGALTALAAVTGLQKPYWGTNSGIIDVGYGVWLTDGQIKIPYGVLLRGAGTGNTTIKLNAGRNCNVIQSAAWGKTGVNDIDDYIKIEQLTVDGNVANQTNPVYQGATSNTVTLSLTEDVTLPVYSTGNMPSSGMIFVANCVCSYTGKTATSFTGVRKIKGESTTILRLARVMSLDSQGHGIALQATRSICEDVTVGSCMGSGFAVQSTGMSSPGIAYENKFDRCRSGGHDRYGWEVIESATDGHIYHSSGGVSKMGTLYLGAVNWHITDFHPVGITSSDGKGMPRGLIVITAGMQYLTDVYLDTALHDGVVLDTQQRQLPVYGINGDLVSLYGSSMGGGGSVIRVLGNFSAGAGAAVTNCRFTVRHEDGNCAYIVANGPNLRTVSVGNQNFTTQSKAQLLDVSSLPLEGGSVQLFGTLNYTGTQVTETKLVGTAAVGATQMTVQARGNLDTAGVVHAVFPADRIGMKIAYTGITMDGTRAILTGIPTSGEGSILVALSGEVYIGQHYLTGITGSSATAVPSGSLGDSESYAQWSLDKFHVEAEVYSNLVYGAALVNLPANGPSKVDLIDVHAGVGDRQIQLSAVGSPKAVVGTWAFNPNQAAYYHGYNQNSTGTAQNDALTFPEVWLDAGTWTLDLLGFTGVDGAIVTPSLLSLRSRQVAIAGTQDQYATGNAAKRDSFAGIVVKVSGLYSLVLTATSKNASSSSYRARVSGAILSRTA